MDVTAGTRQEVAVILTEGTLSTDGILDLYYTFTLTADMSEKKFVLFYGCIHFSLKFCSSLESLC